MTSLVFGIVLVFLGGVVVGLGWERERHQCPERPVTPEDFRER